MEAEANNDDDQPVDDHGDTDESDEDAEDDLSDGDEFDLDILMDEEGDDDGDDRYDGHNNFLYYYFYFVTRFPKINFMFLHRQIYVFLNNLCILDRNRANIVIEQRKCAE